MIFLLSSFSLSLFCFFFFFFFYQSYSEQLKQDYEALLNKLARAENTIDALKLQRSMTAAPAAAAGDGHSEAETEKVMQAARRAISERDELREREAGLRTQALALQKQVEALQRQQRGQPADGENGAAANGAEPGALRTQLEQTQQELAYLRAVVQQQQKLQLQQLQLQQEQERQLQEQQRQQQQPPPQRKSASPLPPTPKSVRFDEGAPRTKVYDVHGAPASPPPQPDFDGPSELRRSHLVEPSAPPLQDMPGGADPVLSSSQRLSLHGNRLHEPTLAVQVADMRDVVNDHRRTLVALIHELNTQARQRAEADRVYDNLVGLKAKADGRNSGSPNNLWQREQLAIQLDREAMLRQRREAELQQRLGDYHVQYDKFQELLLQLRTIEARAGLTTMADQLGALPAVQLDVPLPPRSEPLILPRRPAHTVAAPPPLSASVMDHSQDDLPAGVMSVSGQSLRGADSTRRSVLEQSVSLDHSHHDCALHEIPKGRPPLPPRAARTARAPRSATPAAAASTPMGTNTTMRIEDLNLSEAAPAPGAAPPSDSAAAELRAQLDRLNQSIDRISAATTAFPPKPRSPKPAQSVKWADAAARRVSPPAPAERRRARSLSPTVPASSPLEPAPYASSAFTSRHRHADPVSFLF